MIVGRGRELAQLVDLVASTHLGQGGAILLEGEPGIGKTALLDALADQVPGVLLRACGFEGEAGLPFAGMRDLVAPVLDQLDAISVPQAVAIRNALGLERSAHVDPVATEVATARLLQHVATTGPLTVIVDDVQWLDPESMSVVSYVARRAAPLGLALIAACRTSELTPAVAGLPILSLNPLTDDDAERVLRTATDARLGRTVIESLIEAGAGNPLALRELVGSTPVDQLEGRAPLADPMPVSAPVLVTYRRRLDGLPVPTRDALLVAVAEGRGRLQPIAVALQAAGRDLTDLEPAERIGLISLEGDHVVFRHPLVRSVAYQSASPDQRRHAHRLLASVVDDDDRRAWHVGRSVIGPDAAAADELRRMAERALARGADATAAMALTRAAELVDQPATKGALYLRAARAANRSGDLNRARLLLKQAAPLIGDDPIGRADVTLLDAELRMAHGDHRGAFLQLSGQIDAVVSIDPGRAVKMLLFAAKFHIHKMEATQARRAVERAVELAGDIPLDSLRSTSLAIVQTMCGDPGAARTARAAVDISMGSKRGHLHVESLGWPLVWLEEYDLAERFLNWAEHEQRRGGYHSFLPQTLTAAAELALRLGRWERACQAAAEARRLFEETGQVAEIALVDGILARLAAVRGDEHACRRHAAAAIASDQASGLLAASAFAESAVGHLLLSLGRYVDAVDHLERAAEISGRGEVGEPWLLPFEADLAEAYIHAGRPDSAAALVDRFESRAAVVGRKPVLAAAARCRGLLSGSASWAGHFDDALILHEASPTPYERARTQLCYGERLRRAGRRTDARRSLRAAQATFDQLGADAWAKRAAVERRATGETHRSPGTEPLMLTPHERQIALRVVDGATNKEVAAELFITPKTVEFHLGNVYRKLGVRSRVELARHFLVISPDAGVTDSGTGSTGER